MSPINNNNKYWGIYLQDQNLLNNLSNVILNCKLKISTIKFNKYLIQNNIWNAKKMLKIGLMDEII